MIAIKAGVKMKFKMVAITLVVALVLVSSFASIIVAESGENNESGESGFECPECTEDGGDSGAQPMGGDDDRGGPNPW